MVTSSQILNAIITSIKKRAFSKAQSKFQKAKLALIVSSIFLITFKYLGGSSILITIISFLLIRWVHLEVFDIKEGLILGFSLVYSSFLLSLNKSYGFLYRNFLHKIKFIEFFPEFPFDKQTLTNSLTLKEIGSRDRFWGSKLSNRAPRPNTLTLIRIGGAIFLITFHDLLIINFMVIASILFLTDYFDGIIARTQDRETNFGKWSDPIADRLLLLSVIIFLYSQNSIFWGKWLSVMFIPELLLLVLGSLTYLKQGFISPKPVFWGRLKFVLYALGVFSLLASFNTIAMFLLASGIIFSYIAVISYGTRFYQELKGKSIFRGILHWIVKRSERINQELGLSSTPIGQ